MHRARFNLDEENNTKSLKNLIAECEVDTGITDLLEQSSHYTYSKPKK